MPVPGCDERQLLLLVSATYARQLAELLDGLAVVRLTELADVCHMLACGELLAACEAALLRKAAQGRWYMASSVLAVMAWCRKLGFIAALRKAAEYAASNLAALTLCEWAAEQGPTCCWCCSACRAGRSAGLELNRTPQ